jgi:hypothetical protein
MNKYYLMTLKMKKTNTIAKLPILRLKIAFPTHRYHSLMMLTPWAKKVVIIKQREK